jgi:hypothetical protein
LISEIIYQNFKGIKIENNIVSIITIPEIGGKVVSIVNKSSNFEYVYNNNRGLKKSKYDSDYNQEGPTGIDECFPTIGSCQYPYYPWEGISVPDHGEIWPLKFYTKVMDTNSIHQEVYGIRFPYLFSREIKLFENRIIFNYLVRNLCSMDFKYSWSMHPQFVIIENSILDVCGNPYFYIDFSNKHNFGENVKKYRWPYAITENNNKIDFSKIIDINDGSLTKLYILNKPENKIEITYKKVHQKLGVEFHSKDTSFYGIAINKGGWPINKDPYNWIGIESCNCITDKLSDSVKRGFFGLLKQNSTASWQVDLIIN